MPRKKWPNNLGPSISYSGSSCRLEWKRCLLGMPSEEISFFVWVLGGYDNLCVCEVDRDKKGMIYLIYPESLESEVLQVIHTVVPEMMGPYFVESESL